MAENPHQHPTPRKRRLRRRFIVLLIPVVILAIVWKSAEAYIDIERYRPMIDKELELLIELPISFGAMDLRLLPTPRLVVENVALGEDDFMAFSPKVTVTADLARLIHKKLELHTVSIHQLRVQLPEATPRLTQRWADYMLALNTPDPPTGKPMLKVTLDQIVTEDAQVFRGGSRYVTGNLTVTGVTTGAPVFEYAVEGAGIAGAPTATGNFTLTVDRDPIIQGNAKVAGLPLANLTGDSTLPPFILDGDLTYTQAQDDSVVFAASGNTRLASESNALGTFMLDGRYAQGNLALDPVEVKSTPADLLGALTIEQGDRWALSLEKGTLRDTGIRWLTTRLPEIPLADNPDTESVAVLTGLNADNHTSGVLALRDGAFTTAGVDLALGGGLVFPATRGEAQIASNRIDIVSLSSPHLDLSGAIQADFAAETVLIEAKGRLLLAPGFPLPPSVGTAIRLDAGAIAIDGLQATLNQGNVDLAALVFDAAVQEALMSVWDSSASDFVSVPAISGAITFGEGALHLADLGGAGSTLAGAITPNDTLTRWDFACTLESDLANPVWHALYPVPWLKLTGGALSCTSLTGTLEAGALVPSSLRVNAVVSGLAADIHTADFEDRLTLDTVNVEATSDRVLASAGGGSERFGPLDAKGELALATGDVQASLTVRPARMPLIPESWRSNSGAAMVDRIDPLSIEVKYAPASGEVRFNASEPLTLDGTLAFPDQENPRAPVKLHATADLPAEWLSGYVGSASADGRVHFELSINPANGLLALHADASPAELDWPLIHKPAGFPLTLEMNGDWDAGLKTGRLGSGPEELKFDFGDGGIAAESFDIDLAHFAPLLAAGGVLGGRLQGRAPEGLNRLTLTLHDVTVVPNDATPALGAKGEISRHDGNWALTSLAWSAGSSSGVIEARQEDGSWQGSIHANTLDIGELLRVRDALAGGQPAAPADSGSGFAGNLEITAKQLAWREALVADARGILSDDGTAVQLRDFAFANGEGSGTGQFRYLEAREGLPPSVELDVQVQNVNANLIEGLFLEQARGLEGQLDGSAMITFPLDGQPAANGMNGAVQFEARNGTLGKAGLATKLLTALRATDVLRLQIPQVLRDRGLTFNTLTGRIAIEKGVLHVTPFSMADSTYVLEMDARFDFPRDLAEGSAEVQVLEGVTGVARKIPILGEAANLMNKVLGVPIKITGTASDPAFRVGLSGS